MQGADSLSVSTPVINRVVRLPDGSVLNRYWDQYDTPRPESYKEDIELAHQSNLNSKELFRHIRAAAESGWDFSTRWFKDGKSFETIHTTEIIPMDLNCLLFYLEQTLSEAYHRKGNSAKSEEYLVASEIRKTAIIQYCWDDVQNYFLDYDFVAEQRSNQLTLAGAFPLFFKMASPAQVISITEMLSQRFLRPGGLITTLEHSGQQWDAPNGWAPLQWIAYRGLKNYEQHDLASEVKNRWLSLVELVYMKTGKMMEKYNVVDEALPGGGGEYPNQDGFGWTNGVTAAMLNDGNNI
jgi:alpha,alpha-trehalase